ncbi:ribosome maturation factor RimP [Amycolatopsis regifaucium]|uniref:Ribosome maturation factor RimP n=1 Tax=Amycolatopsis regifaucium TaxID=546365 RepID=A0A154ML12_9PSEU|nr:ribosome maturation factor RimP [Amycolatopsis regifaucium]KZB84693.1 ribosome maturation factor RimP [Amycolatopsis regifaucium]OKA03280.1 ribosome maturation factor RimP [Amycolatopsis regifaucium]SFI30519.1 ribosome maturation factor RimP [Amycolatopsis regifaucium]
MPNDLASRLEPIVAEAVKAAGFDLDSFEVQQAGRRQLVKVVVDGDEGVGLDEVASVSRAVSAVLDENEHVLASAYTLEVTSPGLDRPLTQRRHWRRAKFRLVKVTPAEGAPFVGRVGHAGEKSARVLVDGEVRDVVYASVAKAVIEIEFKQPPAEDLKLLETDASALNAATTEPKEEPK